MLMSHIKKIFLLGLISLIPYFNVNIDAVSIVQAIGGLESGNNFTNPNIGNGGGAYQQTDLALKDIGYINHDGSWNAAASGAASKSEYLSCSSCQTKGEIAYLNKQWSYLNSNGSVKNYLGSTGSNGITYNQSALLECANHMGAAGCKDYLANGNNCKNSMCQKALNEDPHFVADLATASAADSSAITRGNNIVDNSSLANGGTVSAGTAAAQMATYCAEEVQKLMQQAGEQAVDNRVTLAANSGTGYTLMNGKGLLDDALSKGGGIGNLTPSSDDDDSVSSLLGGSLANAGYRTASCLDNILSQVTSIGGLFTNLNLDSVLGQLENAVCSRVQSEFSNLVQPAYSEISQLNSDAQIGGGGWLPGMQLGSINVGSGSSNYFTSMLNSDPSWYNANGNDLSSSLGLNTNWNAPNYIFNGLTGLSK